MIPENPIETMDVYASQSQYLTGPDAAAQAAGTVPLDTLPADWWNWLWQQVTKRINEASQAVDSIHNEILSVLQAASITPTAVSTNDLLNAIKAITRTVGSGDTAGAVKSSTKSGYVAIDSGGYMSPNGMGIPTALNTTAKQIVEAINEVLAALNTYKTSTNDSITGLTNSKAPTSHASSATTYGVGSSTNYGHVKLSDNTSSTSSTGEGTAATPAAVKAVKDSLTSNVSSLQTAINGKAPKMHASDTPSYGVGSDTQWGHVKLSDSTSSTSGAAAGIAATPAAVKAVKTAVDDLSIALVLPAGVTVPYAGATSPTGWLLCNGQAVSRTSYPRLFAAIGTTYGQGDGSTTFNVPDLRECNPVGIGKRASGVTNHNELTLGGFQDDQYQQHSHDVGGNTGSTKPTFTGTAHDHRYTPNGTISKHTHNFTPEGTVSSTFTGRAVNTGGMSANSTGTMRARRIITADKDNTDAITFSGNISQLSTETYGGTAWGNGKRNASGFKIDVSHTHSVTAGGTVSSSFSGTSGTTNGTQPTFTGTEGFTANATAGGSVSSHSHSLPSATSVAGTSAGGTHGKLLGMNYIIKT